jgi:hypothetical protein
MAAITKLWTKVIQTCASLIFSVRWRSFLSVFGTLKAESGVAEAWILNDLSHNTSLATYLGTVPTIVVISCPTDDPLVMFSCSSVHAHGQT